MNTEGNRNGINGSSRIDKYNEEYCKPDSYNFFCLRPAHHYVNENNKKKKKIEK